MKQLIYLEWLKLRRYSTFWILISLFCGLYLLWNYGISQSFIKMSAGAGNFLSSGYSFPGVWHTMAYLYSWLCIFLCVMVMISVCNEFSFRTHRQHIIDGLSRKQFLHAKVILVLGLSLTATVFYFVCVWPFGLTGGGSSPLESAYMTFYVFLYTLNYLSFSALLAFFIRRSGLSILLLLAYFVVEAIFSGLINWQTGSSWGNLLPLQCSDELLPLPVLKTLTQMTGVSNEIPEHWLVAGSLIYPTIYYLIARRRMLYADL